MSSTNSRNHIARHYTKWAYIFIIPFVVAFLLFNFYPLGSTFYYAFCDLKHAGNTDPKFLPSIGQPLFKNFAEIFGSGSFRIALGNTFLFWICATIPEWILAFWLATMVTDRRLNIKGRWLFKLAFLCPQLMAGGAAVAYIMGSVMEIIGFTYIASMINGFGFTEEDINFFMSVRFLIIVVYALMHFGITFIYAVAGITGIPMEVFEAAEIDGANRIQTFFHITIPCMKPIMFFISVISIVDGIGMSDVPDYFGAFDITRKNLTLMNYLKNQAFMGSYLYDRASAASVILLLIFILFAIILYFIFLRDKDEAKMRKIRKKELREARKTA